MTMTTTAAIEITCPDWCVESAAFHADNLYDLGGTCDHRPDAVTVHDPVGIHEFGRDPRYCAPADVLYSQVTGPDGQQVQSPLVFINGSEYSVEQACALAETILNRVAEYSSWPPRAGVEGR